MGGIPPWLSITPQFFTSAMEAGARLGLQAREAQQRSNDAAQALADRADERHAALEERQAEHAKNEVLSREKLVEAQRQFAITTAQSQEKIDNAKSEQGRLDAIREGVLKKNLSLLDLREAQAKWTRDRQPVQDEIQQSQKANELLRLQTAQEHLRQTQAKANAVPEPKLSVHGLDSNGHIVSTLSGPAPALISSLGSGATNFGIGPDMIRRFSAPVSTNATNRWVVKPFNPTNAVAGPLDEYQPHGQ